MPNDQIFIIQLLRKVEVAALGTMADRTTGRGLRNDLGKAEASETFPRDAGSEEALLRFADEGHLG